MFSESQLNRYVRRVLREEASIPVIPVMGFKRLRPEENDLPLPSYQTPGSVAMDIQACLPEHEIPCLALHTEVSHTGCKACSSTGKMKIRSVTLNAHERMAIPTGFAPKLPPGYETQIRSRSGLALKEGIIVLNSPGTIDWDYTGELKIILFNVTGMPFVLTHGMRIAQMAITPIVQAATQEVQDLPVTGRGEGGFGSTGK